MKLLHFVKIIDHVKWLFFVQRRGKGEAKGRLSRYVEIFWNKKGFSLFYTEQIDFMLTCFWYSNRLQKTSECGKNISDTLGHASCATFFFPHFDDICDLLLNRRTATWNLFVKHCTHYQHSDRPRVLCLFWEFTWFSGQAWLFKQYTTRFYGL